VLAYFLLYDDGRNAVVKTVTIFFNNVIVEYGMIVAILSDSNGGENDDAIDEHGSYGSAYNSSDGMF
jgi:hypothetical protein